jgi:CHAT domain-containing protein
VLATRWDIPDEAGQDLMATFYRELRGHPEPGPAFALQQAQIALLRTGAANSLNVLGAWFLLGRV